jgi:hypothetical protein
MTVPERVAKFLREWKGYAFCNRCIAEKLNLPRPQQAQQATSALATAHGYRQVQAFCYECGLERKVTIWRSN